MSLFLAFLLAAAEPPSSPPSPNYIQGQAPAAQASVPDPETAKFEQAGTLVRNGHPADAMPLLDELIADLEAKHGGGSNLFFCARSMSETLVYATMGASAKKNATVLNSTWCYSYYYKGFALIDLGRADEAKAFYDKAIALAPMNSQFLGERAEWYKSRKDWPRAYADFKAAANAAGLSPDDMKSFDQRRAWRGMAFVRTEEGKLDEARELLQKCIKLDPSDENARHELEYIKSLRPSVS